MQNCVNPLASNSEDSLFQFWCWRLPSRSPRGCHWSSWWYWWGRPRLSSPPPPLITAGFPGSTRCVGTRGWPQSAAIIMTGRTSSPDHHVNDHDNDSDNDAASDHERWGCRAQGREWRGHQGDPGISQQVRVVPSSGSGSAGRQNVFIGNLSENKSNMFYFKASHLPALRWSWSIKPEMKKLNDNSCTLDQVDISLSLSPPHILCQIKMFFFDSCSSNPPLVHLSIRRLQPGQTQTGHRWHQDKFLRQLIGKITRLAQCPLSRPDIGPCFPPWSRLSSKVVTDSRLK